MIILEVMFPLEEGEKPRPGTTGKGNQCVIYVADWESFVAFWIDILADCLNNRYLVLKMESLSV